MVRHVWVLVLFTLAAPRAAKRSANTNLVAGGSDLTVHEWGTFTSVAGPNGRSVEWLPLGGPTDLPCFVEHFQNRATVKLAPDQRMSLDYATARATLWGRVRMETPVLYFYASRPTTAKVRVRFPRGLMTEWYPHATVSQPLADRLTLRRAPVESVIEWRNVTIAPNAVPHFPVGKGQSHYYAARNTDAAPLVVDGQSEKFLFYRGVASFDVPLSAVALADGRVRARNLGVDAVPGLVLFENRSGVVRYRVYGALRGESVLAAPRHAGSVAGIRHDLERMLVGTGLYPKEAAAMVESWRDSWFEEGTRVLYIVPPQAVDAILPLTVEPAPTRVVRAFVGRMELITPDIERSVRNALVANDVMVLERYGRFLGPIADRIGRTHPDTVMGERIRQATDIALTTVLHRASLTCASSPSSSIVRSDGSR